TAGARRLSANLTGTPRARKLGLGSRAPRPAAAAWAAARWSARSRQPSRASIKAAPSSHTTPSTAAAVPLEMPFATSPTRLSGVAHERCDAKDLSSAAPSGRTKLSAVATQIQYFVVALPPRIEVRAQAASPTIDAYRRWTSR